MKIGILEAGRPPAALEPCFGRYAPMFETLLGPSYAFASYSAEAGELPASSEEQEAYVVTGSSAGVYDDLPWIEPLKAFLRETKGRAKLVGVCFGHQIMAEAFGGRVEKSSNGWGVGLHRYDVRDGAPWMDDIASFAIPASHQDQIVVQPPKSRVLAGSDFNPFGLLSYEDQPAISFQCHPEFDPTFAKALVEARRERLDGADEAIASLDAPNDRARVADWIRRFLAGGISETA